MNTELLMRVSLIVFSFSSTALLLLLLTHPAMSFTDGPVR